MILAGIDEAGYGPILGPLTVGCCAVRVPPASEDESLPDAWKLLRRVVSRKRDRTGRTLHVNDSKQVYTPSAGLAELERSVLAWLSAVQTGVESFEAVLGCLSPEAAREAARVPWYAAEGEAHLAEADPAAVRISANALRQECGRVGVTLLPPRVEVVFEATFNRLCAATRNKSQVLFSTTARHIDRLLREHAQEGITIVCDRHGGRSHYAPLLRLMFEEWDLSVLDEQDKRAEYALQRGDARARLIFAEKGDGLCLATAMASMLAKYTRERLMGRLNAFWRQHAPEVAPTAGYWSDGQRFLQEIAPARQRLGVRDELLVRQR